MQCLDLVTFGRSVTEQPQLVQQPDHGGPVRLVDLGLFLHRPGQQPEPLPQVDVLTGQVPGGRRQVVRGDRGQAQLAPALRAQRLALAVLLEPQDRRAQQPAFAQVVPGPRLDRAKIFADHHRTGPMSLERQDADQRLVVVPHVGALVGGQTGRHPPEPEEADDVVHPDRPGVPQHCPAHVPERRVAQLGEPVRPPRRLAPVLPLLVERVRRGTAGDVPGQHVLHRPDVRPVRMHPDRQIVDETDHHPGVPGHLLRPAELLVGAPLQPAVEVDPIGQLVAHLGDRGAARVAGVGRPTSGRQPVPLGQCAPGREVDQALALPLAERLERGLPGRRPGHQEHRLERSPLGLPDDVPVQLARVEVELAHRLGLPRHDGPVGGGQVADLADVLDPQVDRVQEPPGGRQVRGRLHRGDRLGRVQRIHQHEAGAV